MKFKLIYLLLVWILFGPVLARSQDMLVQPSLQVALFKKIFLYDKKLRTQEQIFLFVVSAGEYSDDVKNLVTVFKGVGLNVDQGSAAQLAEKADQIDVVYVLPDQGYQLVKEICEAHKILSISGVAELAEQGNVALSLGLNPQGKAQIIVHLGRLKTENHQLSAELLKLAKVIR